jgi:4'-phosphopantetheinyl transferase
MGPRLIDMNQPACSAELWLVNLAESAGILGVFESAGCLSGDDVVRLSRIESAIERDNRRRCYVALRWVLERWLGSAIRGVVLDRTSEGRPSVPGAPVDFSLSHAAHFALIAVSRQGPLGVDIELQHEVDMPTARREEIVAAAAGFSGTPEGDPSSDADFLSAWTIVEAYGKACGQGLPQVLSELGLFKAKRAGSVQRREITEAAGALAHAARLQVSPLCFADPLAGALVAPKGLTVPPIRSFPSDKQALSEALPPRAGH